MLGSIIGAVGSLFGAKQQASEQSKLFDRQQDFSERWNRRALDWSKEQHTRLIRTRVDDAKAAGIHPLYALGASGGSPVSFMSGGHPTGSGLGTGIAAAAQTLGEGVNRATRKLDPVQLAQVKLLEAQTAKTNVEALAQASLMKRAEQRQNEVRTFPLGELPGMKLRQRGPSVAPLQVDRDISAGGTVLSRLPSGRVIRALNPEVYESEVLQTLGSLPALLMEGGRIASWKLKRMLGIRPSVKKMRRSGGYYPRPGR